MSCVKLHPDHSLFDQGVKTDGTVQLSLQIIAKPGIPMVHGNKTLVRLMKPSNFPACINACARLLRVLRFCPGEEKLNILEIVKPVETVEVVIDPDAAGEETALVEEGQLIAVERSGLSDETSEQVTRWAAALEGYRKEQVRLGIPYGEDERAAIERNKTISLDGVDPPRFARA